MYTEYTGHTRYTVLVGYTGYTRYTACTVYTGYTAYTVYNGYIGYTVHTGYTGYTRCTVCTQYIRHTRYMMYNGYTVYTGTVVIALHVLCFVFSAVLYFPWICVVVYTHVCLFSNNIYFFVPARGVLVTDRGSQPAVS